jgi:hypothetical protein
LIPLVLAAISCSAAQKHLSADSECSEDIPIKETFSKSAQITDKGSDLKAYGRLSFRRLSGVKEAGCHVVYQLFVAVHGAPFVPVKQITWDTEDGEIAGIDLIGTSPDGTKFAANFWHAQGDWQEHRPVIYDLATGQAVDRPLEDRIQKRIESCDQLEDFIGVTNAGKAIFAVPASIYDDGPKCGDKGLWYFNLKTGSVYRVAKISGDKWR